jgi:hypothetical protein
MPEKAGLEFVDARGLVFNPLSWQWRISERDLSVNYVTTTLRAAAGALRPPAIDPGSNYADYVSGSAPGSINRVIPRPGSGPSFRDRKSPR